MATNPPINVEKVRAIQSEDDLHAQVHSMKQEIDGLQIAFTNQKKPWFRDVSTLIAVLALTFSFGTTMVSYRRTDAQDVQASRQELRGILQRTSAIPRELLEASKKYSGDQNSINSVSQLYNEENLILAGQAAEIARKLPKGLVSATEFYSVAIAFQNSGNLSGTQEFLKYAIENASDFEDEIAAVRSQANFDFITGQPNAGRAEYETALDIFAKYPTNYRFMRGSTNANIELQWAYAEAGIGQFSLADQRIKEAMKQLSGLPPSPALDGLNAQVAQAHQIIFRDGKTSVRNPLAATPAFTIPKSLVGSGGPPPGMRTTP